MDNQRAVKRRKLDHTPAPGLSPQQAPSASPKAQSHVQDRLLANSQHGLSSLLRQGSPKGTPSTYEAWLRAKERNRTAKDGTANTTPRKAAVSVYDDVEQAHAAKGGLNIRPMGTPSSAKKSLDPLRNQKAGNVLGASPVKSLASEIFKDLQRPRPASAIFAQNKALEPVSQSGGDRLPAVVSNDVVAGASESEDNASTKTRAEGCETVAQSAGKRWHYATQPPRTFEDEIREVARVAQEQAEAMEDAQGGNFRSERRKRVDYAALNGSSAEKRRRPEIHHREVEGKAGSQPKGREHQEKLSLRKSTTVNTKSIEHEVVTKTPAPLPAVRTQDRAKVFTTLPRANLEPQHILLIRTIILEKLTGKRPTKLVNMDDEVTKVQMLIQQTIEIGESNSMLLIGARGSGKTALVNQIIRDHTGKAPQDFLVVRLNGFVHTDDKLALREIWRQLGQEMNIDEDENVVKNYADTLTTLLAVLSHPSEHAIGQPEHASKSVIFVLDEFDLFAHHPRQTLLYNLFDIAQSRKAPIAVLGLTPRVDVADSLEKRVKSRFSHRYVHLNLSKNLFEFQEACKSVLVIDHDEMTKSERQLLGAADSITRDMKTAKKSQEHTVLAGWNALVEKLFDSAVITHHLRRLYYTTKSVAEFHTSMLGPVASLPADTPATLESVLTHLTSNLATWHLTAPDSKLSLLASLSTLQLALLICTARLNAIYQCESVPFVQAYEEYKTIASKAKLQASASGNLAQGANIRVWSKDIARNAWSGLVDLGLIMTDGIRGNRIDVGLEEIGGSGVDLGGWGRWCKEI